MLYVGDEQRDVAACKKAGVNVIWVSWGYDVIETVKKRCTRLYGQYTYGNCTSSTRGVFLI